MKQYDVTMNDIRSQINAIESGDFASVRGYVTITQGQATKKLMADVNDEFGYYLFVERRYPSRCIQFQPRLLVEFWDFDMLFDDFKACINRIIACYKHALIPSDAELMIKMVRVSYTDDASVKQGYDDIIKALAPYGVTPEQIQEYQAGEVYGVYVGNMHEYQYTDSVQENKGSDDENDALAMSEHELDALYDKCEENVAADDSTGRTHFILRDVTGAWIAAILCNDGIYVHDFDGEYGKTDISDLDETGGGWSKITAHEWIDMLAIVTIIEKKEVH